MAKVIIKNNKINWVCLGDKCSKNCCGPYESTANYQSLWGVNENMIPLNQRDYESMVEKGLLKYLSQERDGGWYIKTMECGTCPLLQNNRCLIYNNKPNGCKAYPFFFMKYNGLCVDLSCPGWGKGWTGMEEVKLMVKNLISVYEFQIEKAKKKLGIV